MNINWTLRLKNKAWLAALIATILTFLLDVLELLGVNPPIPRDALTSAILTLLTALGVIIDPTTPGVNDGET